MTIFSMSKDVQGQNAFAPQFSDVNYGVNLAAGAEQHFTVPALTDATQFKNWMAIFSVEPGSNVFVNNITTATVFSGTLGVNSSQLNPAVRIVKPGSVLSFITPDTTAYCGVSLYLVP